MFHVSSRCSFGFCPNVGGGGGPCQIFLPHFHKGIFGQKALSNVICKFLHIHAIVLNLIHRPVLVLTWGNLSHRKKHWASMSRGVAFDVILHFCPEATSETPDVCRPLVEVANKCWHSLRKSGLQILVSTSFTNCLLKELQKIQNFISTSPMSVFIF